MSISASANAMAPAGSMQPAMGGKVKNALPQPADAVANAMPVPHAGPAAQEGVAEKPDAGGVQRSLDDINKVMAGFSISVRFQVDPDYKELIVKVVDQDTGKLIRQIPTEDVVKMSKAMDNLKGLLFAQPA